jgi:sestrin
MHDLFLFSGRIPKHERIMGNFPFYLDKHFEVIKIIFESDLSLPYVWRYYIAYMAAATHKCEYLMKLEKFYSELFHNSWIFGEVPEKISLLGNANVKLAHRPWEFGEKDIKELLTVWNLNELILALTLMCQFHCLAGFVFGVGIVEDSDFPNSTFKEPASPSLKQSKTSVTSILKSYSESTEYEDYISDSSEDLNGEDEDIYFSRLAGGYLPYINYPMDFIARSFNASDFKFSDQAIYILEKIVPEISDSVWNRIRMTFAMTYDTIGQDSGVETAPLRRAIWNYVQRVYGLQYDDYNYTDVNRLLGINTKKYIKKVACMPETVSKNDYLSIEYDLSHDDMIHLNLLICEARFEAQLVYMLHPLQ